MLANFENSAVAKRSNQSILKEIGPEYSLEELMLKLKLQYLAHLMLGKIEGGKRRGRQRMRWLDGITDLMVRHCAGHKHRGVNAEIPASWKRPIIRRKCTHPHPETKLKM